MKMSAIQVATDGGDANHCSLPDLIRAAAPSPLYRTSLHSPTQGTGDKRPSSTLPSTPCSLSLCSVVCLCVSVCCVSVFCAQRWSSKPDLFALPHARRRRQRNTCFQFLSYMSAMCYCSFSSINSSQSMSGGPACSRSKSSCPGCNSTPRFITAIPSRYVYNELIYLKQRL